MLMAKGRALAKVEVKDDGTIEIREQPSAAPDIDYSDPLLNALSDRAQSQVFDAETQQHIGCVLGIALASYRKHAKEEGFLLLPGDDVQLTMPTAGTPPKAASETFTIVDFYESKMSEY